MKSKKIGVILNNLGTPKVLTPSAIRDFLREFLSDPMVVDLPRWFWLPLLYGVILPFRPKKLVEAYGAIWTEQGSPLMLMTQTLATVLQQQLGTEYIVEVGMRYGQPSIAEAYQALQQQGVAKVIVLPLYPQYSISTTRSVEVLCAKVCQSLPHHVIAHYYEHPAYINALANKINQYWQQHGRADYLLMSFHGIPAAFLRKGDPYFQQCQKTAYLLAEVLTLTDDQWRYSFQSRLGKAQWLQPYTDKVVEDLAQQGVQTVDVVCPGFPIDCLETLEEIAVENRDVFIEHGGRALAYIPALNDSDEHAHVLSQLIKESPLK